MIGICRHMNYKLRTAVVVKGKTFDDGRFVFWEEHMNIGICDDDEGSRLLIKKCIEKENKNDEVNLFNNSIDVKQYFENRQLDILYLDIDLKDVQDGLSLAKELKEEAIKEGIGGITLPLIIFVTGYPERMLEAFSVTAYHFLVKPIDEEQFRSVLNKARKTVRYLLSNRSDRVLKLRNDGVTFTIKETDIYYIESFGRKLCFYTKNGDIESYGKISDKVNELGDAFYQSHRSFIVNMKYISDYSKNEISLESGMNIPLSKYKHDEFVKSYATFLRKQAL